MIQEDSHALPVHVEEKGRGLLCYDLQGMIRLRDFLEAYTFEKEEGYGFLLALLENAILCNRAKPVLFDPDFIFVSPYGDDFGFVVLPVHVEMWLVQEDSIRAWVKMIRELFQTRSAYEIPGFIQQFEHSAEFSLPALVQGLRALHRTYHPARLAFFFPRKPLTFRAKEAVRAYVPETEETDENKTELLCQPSCPAVLKGKEEFPLLFPSMEVGRSLQCDIRLEEETVSLLHARIVEENGRFYIQDLKSTNGTYLNGKRVVRRMRLRPGMEVCFGKEIFVFETCADM
jgi:hypothetical protein